MGAVLAIDHGEKKTGFALADGLRIVIRPLEVYRAAGTGDELLARIAHHVDEHPVDTFLVGLPVHMDGSESERSQAVRAFQESLRSRFPRCSIHLHDERLTTKEAESLLFEAGYRGQDIRKNKDSWAAYVLLMDWIRAGEPA